MLTPGEPQAVAPEVPLEGKMLDLSQTLTMRVKGQDTHTYCGHKYARVVDLFNRLGAPTNILKILA